ncbi:catalase [Bacteriovorax antarcticus]|uniref:catalase n=1 Tax=Bacteriovorax antarcticus TaxID=3088717 RepID=UPI00396B2D77
MIINILKTAGERGSLSIQKMYCIEKLVYFNRARIQERVAYAKGSGTYRALTITEKKFYSPSSPIASTGQASIALLHSSSSCGVLG